MKLMDCKIGEKYEIEVGEGVWGEWLFKFIDAKYIGEGNFEDKTRDKYNTSVIGIKKLKKEKVQEE